MTFDGAIVDLDGTVYRGEALISGADRGIDHLRNNGVDVAFVSNNPLKKPAQYHRKLTALGINVGTLLTSASVTATYLARDHSDSQVFVIGEEPLRKLLSEQNVSLTEQPNRADVVLISTDRSFDYERLDNARAALDSETEFIVTNRDRTCPLEEGERSGAEGMVSAVTGVTGREPNQVLGKPSSHMAQVALDRLGAAAEDCLLVGDRLETDIRMGERAGMTTALVLSGSTDRTDITTASIQPDFVIDTLADVTEVIVS